MLSTAQVRSAIHAALDRVGHRNSHACPGGKGNIDPYLHELFVAHEGWSHFDKRRKLAIKASIDVAGQDEADKVAPGTEQSVLEGEYYSLVIKKNNPAVRIDKAKIGTALRKLGFDEGQVVQFMTDISTETKPATSVRAVPKG